MVQFRVLAGAALPATYEIRQLPCVVGRKASASVRLEAPGVWDEHIRLEQDSERRIGVQVLEGALLVVNGQTLQRSILRNGDVLELGAVKLQFWLSPTRQRSFRMLEVLTWVVLGVVSITEIAVVYGMLR